MRDEIGPCVDIAITMVGISRGDMVRGVDIAITTILVLRDDMVRGVDIAITILVLTG